MGHEVGHALFTPNENWKLKYPELPHNFVNILEDVRVERLIKRRFAGIHKTFFHGYAKLADDDFFGISETDIEDLTLADRLNLFFKIGNFEDIPFSGKEQYFVDRATQLETFSDVLELSRELWQHCKDSVESPNDLPPQQKVKAQQGDNTSEQSENIQPQSEPSQPQNSGEDGGDSSDPGDWDELDELMEQNVELRIIHKVARSMMV